MQAIWQLKVRSLHHRIIWWLVDVGAVGRTVRFGWQKQCSEQLGIHRLTIHRNVILMIEADILKAGEKRGEVSVNPLIFRHVAEKAELRMGE